MRKNRNMKNLKYNWTNYVKYCIINLCGEISTVFNIIAGIITIIKSTNTIIP